jgi:hypothetical protein
MPWWQGSKYHGFLSFCSVNLPACDQPHFNINSFLISWRNGFSGLLTSEECCMRNFIMQSGINSGTSGDTMGTITNWLPSRCSKSCCFFENSLVGVGAVLAVRICSWNKRQTTEWHTRVMFYTAMSWILEHPVCMCIFVCVCACAWVGGWGVYISTQRKTDTAFTFKALLLQMRYEVWSANGGLVITVALWLCVVWLLAVVKAWKVAMDLVMSVRPSVSTRFPLYVFTKNFKSYSFIEICRQNTNVVNIVCKHQKIYMKK